MREKGRGGGGVEGISNEGKWLWRKRGKKGTEMSGDRAGLKKKKRGKQTTTERSST